MNNFKIWTKKKYMITTAMCFVVTMTLYDDVHGISDDCVPMISE